MAGEPKDIYMNPVQQRISYMMGRDMRLLAARRLGKTDTVGYIINAYAQSMPRGVGGWVAANRRQLYARTIPGSIAAMNRFFNYTEGVHFGFGRPPKGVPRPVTPPKSWDNVFWFANGWIFHLVSMATAGSANGLSLCSLVLDEAKFTSKQKLDQEVMPALSGLTDPLGNPAFSENNPFYKGTFFCSDASLTAKGNWLEKEESKLDLTLDSGPFQGRTYRSIQEELDQYAHRLMHWNELLREAKNGGHRVRVVTDETKHRIQALAQAVTSHEGPYKILPAFGKTINKATCEFLVNYKLCSVSDAELLFDEKFLITKAEHFDLMQLKQSHKYAEHIRQLRCNAFCFFRASTFDNIAIIGLDYIRRLKRDLPASVFAVSVLNMKRSKCNDGFYANLDIENIHGYISADCPAIDGAMKIKTASVIVGGTKYDSEYETPDFGQLGALKDCTLDDDVVDNLPLHISFDYNANINWIVTGQIYRRDQVEALNVISSMYVKNEEKIHALLAKWNSYYAPHRRKNRTVYYYYDNTSKFRDYAIENSEGFCVTIIKQLQKYGWDVVGVDIGVQPRHEQRYKIINEALGGFTYPAIRINRENNEALIVAMENCEVSIGYKGFRKDKSGEKLSEDADGAVMAEFRTDGTDAFDTLYWGVKFYRTRLVGLCMPSGH